MERYIVVDNSCGWPNLTMTDDGDIILAAFNRPYHWNGEGEVDCYISNDDGFIFKYAGTPLLHKPGTAHGNVNCGLAHNGDYIALVGGWDGLPPEDIYRKQPSIDITDSSKHHILFPEICRSSDKGKTFAHSTLKYIPNGEIFPFNLYGNIIRLPDHGRLATALFSMDYNDRAWNRGNAYIVFSDDDGYTWNRSVEIAHGHYNETSIVLVDERRILAFCRTFRQAERLDIYVSDDLGENWRFLDPVTTSGMIPGMAIKLLDNRLLLTFGIRCNGFLGVGVKISEDGGENWGRIAMLAEFEGAADGGYPSTRQLADNTLLTAYYAGRCKDHTRYHVGMLHWRLDEFYN